MYRPLRATEEPPRFMRSEIGNNFPAGQELVANSLEAVRIHDGRHHLAIDGERDIDDCILDQRRPMLIAHRVSQFDARAHCCFWREAHQLVQMHDHHVAQFDSRDKRRACLGIPEQHVSVADMGVAVD
jgi:hypothetical protein